MGIIIDNIKYGHLMPQEDYFLEKENIFCVADGITRDPIIPEGIETKTLEEALKYYPNPSGAAMAAETFCSSFVEFLRNKTNISQVDIKEAFVYANEKIKALNSKYIKECDYLTNDFYGCVASGVVFENGKMFWGVITDCAIAVYDKNFKIKFKTPNYMTDFSNYSIPEIVEKKLDWIKDPECRQIVRRDYRNASDKIASYGALTGEETALSYIHTGEVDIDSGDYIFLYSDGFENLMNDDIFIQYLLLNFEDDEKIIGYAQRFAKEDYNKYGKERTLIKIKIQ
jgi:serine/threonine protein phosphatase PrpC